MKHKGAETATKHFKLPVNILLLLFLRFIAYLFRCEDTKKIIPTAYIWAIIF